MMDIFEVETGTAPATTCHDESVSTLQGGLSSGGKDGSSKVFLVHDSLTCISNVSLGLSECSLTKPDVVEGHHTKDESSERKKTIRQMTGHKSTNKTKPGSTEYRCLSPRNLEDAALSPSRSITKDYLEETLSQTETDNLLQPRDLHDQECPKEVVREIPLIPVSSVSFSGLHISTTSSSSEESPKRSQRSNASTLSVHSDEQPSTSSSPENQEVFRKKTLEQLAREWHASQKNGRNEDVIRKQSMKSCCEDESMLVRHTIYYTTTSSLSRDECRLKNKIKARRLSNDDNVKRFYAGVNRWSN